MVVTVTDDGPGVDASLRDSLFEPGATTTGSAGLGLALARRIARNAGGDVTSRVAARARPDSEISLPATAG